MHLVELGLASFSGIPNFFLFFFALHFLLTIIHRSRRAAFCLLSIGPGRLCLKVHLLFYPYSPTTVPIILFKLPIIPVHVLLYNVHVPKLTLQTTLLKVRKCTYYSSIILTMQTRQPILLQIMLAYSTRAYSSA